MMRVLLQPMAGFIPGMQSPTAEESHRLAGMFLPNRNGQL